MKKIPSLHITLKVMGAIFAVALLASGLLYAKATSAAFEIRPQTVASDLFLFPGGISEVTPMFPTTNALETDHVDYSMRSHQVAPCRPQPLEKISYYGLAGGGLPYSSATLISENVGALSLQGRNLTASLRNQYALDMLGLTTSEPNGRLGTANSTGFGNEIEAYSYICDNQDSCFEPHMVSGNWGYITTQSCAYNNHAWWTYNCHDCVEDWGLWRANLTYSGEYDIYFWYPHYPGSAPETNSAHYCVHYDAGDYCFTWNQASNYCQWAYVTTKSCNSGNSCFVQLTDQGDETHLTRRVWFDTVKWVLKPPTTPELNNISNPDQNGTYDVNWNLVFGATDYTIQEDDNSAFNSPTQYTTPATIYSVNGQSSGTWYYRVRASNPAGYSSWSVVKSVSVLLPPSSPTLYEIDNPENQANYTVDWSDVPWADSYLLQEDDNFNFSTPETCYSGSNSYVNVTGQESGNWYYRVQAQNSSGSSSWSAVKSVFVLLPPSPPTLHEINNPDYAPDYTVDWSDVPWADTYLLQRDDNADFSTPETCYSGSATDFDVTGQEAGYWYYRVQANNAGGNSPWSNTELVIIHSPEGDDYEPDDTCTQAREIPDDGTIQEHTFHVMGDEDWIWFDATAGTSYLIKAQVPPDSEADLILELYSDCSGLPEATQGHSFSAAVRLEFESPIDGPIYLRWLNEDTAVYGSDIAYQFSVQALIDQPALGALVLVAGRLKENDSLQDNIHHVTGEAYNLFVSQGYDDERILYLATDIGLPGVDALPSVAHLESALTIWAQDKVGPDQALTLYMIDHGSHDKLYLDKPRGEWVTPQEVDNWLDYLESAVPGVKINIIVEACNSGSFIDLIHTVSKPGRVVMASTGAWQLAWASNQGAVFSDHFIAALAQDTSLFGSFLEAKWATEIAHPDQTPWLDDNGDGIANSNGDGEVASQRGFAFAGTLGADAWPPNIADGQVTNVSDGGGTIQAEVEDDENVKRVWAVIYPPDYQPPASGEEIVQEVLPTIMLLDLGNNQFGAVYTGFDDMGTYRVVIYAEDYDGLESRPFAFEFQLGAALYLPLLVRSP